MSTLSTWHSLGPRRVDLDLRDASLPSGLQGHGLQRCTACGYVASDLSHVPSRPERAVLESEAGRALSRSYEPWDRLSLHAQLAEARQAPQEAMGSWLAAAWELDDWLERTRGGATSPQWRQRQQLAAQFRLQALRAMGDASTPSRCQRPGLQQALRCDLLRRAGAAVVVG